MASDETNFAQRLLVLLVDGSEEVSHNCGFIEQN
jgi:hypothetical protein